jgi:hypothetical protein
VAASPIVICDGTGELGRSHPRPSAACGKRLRQRQAEALERADVDEVADLRAPEEGAELVREDLLGRVHPDDTVPRFFGPQLLRVLDDEIDDDRVVPPGQEDPAELRSGSDVLPGRPRLRRCRAKGSHAVLHGRRKRKEIQVVGFPMSQVIAREGPLPVRKKRPPAGRTPRGSRPGIVSGG